jgi:hypothetical protein
MYKILSIILLISVNTIVAGQALNPGQIGNNQDICYGSAPQALNFSVQPTGGTAPYTYRWQRSNDGSNWYDITGTTATRQTYTPPVLARTAYFRCRVTDAVLANGNTNFVTINVATDLVAAVIGSAQTIYNGTDPSPLTQSSGPSGGSGSYTYRWQVSGDGLAWSDISGATSAGYTPGALTEDRWFRQWVSDAGCGSTASNTVMITVNPITIFTSEVPSGFPSWARFDFGTEFEPLTDGFVTTARIYTGPSEAGLHQVRLWRQNDQAVFEVVAGPYDWSFTSGITGWREFPLPEPVAVEANRYYIISVTNSTTDNLWAQVNVFTPLVTNDYVRYINSGAASVGTVPLQVLNTEQETFFRDIVFVPFYAGAAGQNQTICYNSAPASLTQTEAPSGGEGNYTYQWQSSADGQTWNDVAGAVSQDYQPPVLTSSIYYRRVVNSGDFSGYSHSVFIRVNVPFTLSQLMSSITIYENTSTNISVEITGGTPPYTIEYARNSVPLTAITDYEGGTEINTGILAAGTYEYTLTSVTDGLGCHPLSTGNSITITVSGTAPSTANRNVLVMFNSSSVAYYFNYTDYLRPYLDWFGIPYDTYDTYSGNPLPDLSQYAVIIMGHRAVYSSNYPFSALEAAVAGGTGLFSFDPNMFDTPSGFTEYVGTQADFYSSQINLSTDHFITEYHTADVYYPTNDELTTKQSLHVWAHTYDLANNTVLASLGTGGSTVPLMQVADYGSGRIVKWNSYQWIFDEYLGPVWGMDDLLWKGIVWAARKPFVMQGLPPMVTMRVDDVDDRSTSMINLEWMNICNEYGLIPWVGVFIYPAGYDPAGFFPKLKTLVDNHQATASPHSARYGELIYYNFNSAPVFSAADSVIKARNIFAANNLPMSKYVVPHYYYLTADALAEIRNMGVEFLGTKITYDPVDYPGNWLNNRPYRIGRDGWGGTGVPHFYADSINWEGTPFFLCLSEIGDDGTASSQYEWYPGTGTVSEVIARGVRHLRRSLNSMTLPVLFTHEDQITMTATDWRQMISGVTSGVSVYNPEYLSTDDAITYIRAKDNLKIRDIHSENNLVNISITGANDMETKCYLFEETGGQITHRLVTLPRVTSTVSPVTVCINE